MADEELLAHAIATVLKEEFALKLAPLQQRIQALESENIALRRTKTSSSPRSPGRGLTWPSKIESAAATVCGTWP